MAWRRSGDKPLSEPMMVSSPTHICVTRPQWVKERYYIGISSPSTDKRRFYYLKRATVPYIVPSVCPCVTKSHDAFGGMVSTRQAVLINCHGSCEWHGCEVTTWWRHQMETFSALLAICAGNSPVTHEFPAQRPVTRTLMFSLICAWINGWVNIDEAGDLRHHRAHYDVTVMVCNFR